MSKSVYKAPFPSLGKLVTAAPDKWADSDVSLAPRGVRVSWLVAWLRSLLDDLNRGRIEAIDRARRAMDHAKRASSV
jgi:hypothetical protein